MSHYFINDPNLKSHKTTFTTTIKNVSVRLSSDTGVFAKNSLDLGTKILLENISINPNQTLLDMGCGYGIIGIYLFKAFSPQQLTMVDVNQKALKLAQENILNNDVVADIISSNFFENIKQKFDHIISNPPIRIGKTLLYDFYYQSTKHLNKQGSLWLVVNKKHGAESTIKYLKTLFNHVEIVNKQKGFNVIKATL